jgi:hypothetical protein
MSIATIIEQLSESRMLRIEMLAVAFLKETGLDPSKCELVEQQHANGKVSWFFREREPKVVLSDRWEKSGIDFENVEWEEIPMTGKPECTCRSLLNGHEANCPHGKND